MKQRSKGSNQLKKGKSILIMILLGLLLLAFGAGNVFFFYEGNKSLQIKYTKAKGNAGQEKNQEDTEEHGDNQSQGNNDEENQSVYTSSLESFTISKPNEKAKENKNKTKEIIKITELHAIASSKLAPQKKNTYDASNLLDGNLATTWAEGVKGRGKGQTFTISSDKPIAIKKIVIFNGYQKNKDVLKRNAQIKKVTITASDGTKKTVSLKKMKKCKKSQTIKFETGADGVTEIKFKIVDTYAGKKTSKGAECKDTCVSEVQLYGYTQ